MTSTKPAQTITPATASDYVADLAAFALQGAADCIETRREIAEKAARLQGWFLELQKAEKANR